MSEGEEAAGRAALAAAEAWLLQRELFGIRPGLGRMTALLARLGDPQRAFDAIHVVGSNGKTSTVTMAAGLLEQRGIAAGAYVSPHLVSFRERVLIGGAPSSPERFAAAVEQVRRATDALEADAGGPDGSPLDGPVTQFEAVTAAAFVALADAGVRCAVIEAGLGGRWDATNVLPVPADGEAPPAHPPVAVLTSVSLEHTQWLGNTVAAIAGEKAEVLRPGGTLVLAHGLPDAAREVAVGIARERGATVVDAPDTLADDVPAPGAARYQRHNLATAIAAVAAYLGPDAPRDPVAEREVAAHVIVPGRFETVEPDPAHPDGPVVIYDGAHNEAGVEALADALDGAPPSRPLVVVIGVLDDKDPAAMLAALDRWCDAVVAVAPRNPRAVPAAQLAESVRAVLPGREVHVATGAHDGIRLARTLAGSAGTVLATGSLHLIADLRRGPDAPPGASF